MTNNDFLKSDSINTAIEALRKDYVNGWPKKHERLEILIKNLERNPKDTTTIEEFRMNFHRLAGSGGSYGLPEVSVTAREAELFIAPLLDADEAIPPEAIKKIQNYIKKPDQRTEGQSS